MLYCCDMDRPLTISIHCNNLNIITPRCSVTVESADPGRVLRGTSARRCYSL